MSGHERDRLSAYLDGELPPGERAEVEAHLAACPACTALLADMTAAEAAAASLPAEAPEGYFDAFPSRVVARIGAASRARRRTHRLPAWTWAAAAALLLAVVVPLTLRQPPPGPVPAPPPAARPQPAFASPPAGALPAVPTVPAAAESRQPAGKSTESKLESGAARAPLKPPAAPAESAKSRPKPADALAESAAREEPARVTTEAFAAPDGAQEPAPRRATARAAASAESPAHRDERAAGAVSVPEPETAFGRLETSRPRSAMEWRRLRDAWSAFAAAHPEDPRADEARVRAIEAGREAWLAGGDDDDAAAFHRNARAYLEREDALQKERVERLLRPAQRP